MNPSMGTDTESEMILCINVLHVDLFFLPNAVLVSNRISQFLEISALRGPWTGRCSIDTVCKNHSNQKDPEKCLPNNFMLSKWGMAPTNQLLKSLGKTIYCLHLSRMIFALCSILCTMNSMPHFPAAQPDWTWILNESPGKKLEPQNDAS